MAFKSGITESTCSFGPFAGKSFPTSKYVCMVVDHYVRFSLLSNFIAQIDFIESVSVGSLQPTSHAPTLRHIFSTGLMRLSQYKKIHCLPPDYICTRKSIFNLKKKSLGCKRNDVILFVKANECPIFKHIYFRTFIHFYIYFYNLYTVSQLSRQEKALYEGRFPIIQMI